MRCQSGERLSPTSPNTQEKSIPWSLPQDPADSADVLYRIHEKHKLQFWGVALIVLLQVVVNHKLQLWVEMLSCGYQIKAIVGEVYCLLAQPGVGESRAWCLTESGSSSPLGSYKELPLDGLNLVCDGGSSCSMVTLN